MPVLTPQGIEIPTVETLLSEISEELRAAVDPTLDTSPESPEGQIAGVFASHLREAWEVIALLFNLDPASAEDFMLDWISSLTGTYREGATRSTFRGVRSVVVNLNAGTTLPVGSEAHVVDKPEIRFRTTEEVTNADAVPADVLVEMESLDEGPIVCNAGTLTVIATPVVGWNAVTNPTDCERGQIREEDPPLRVRRERELRAPGSGNVDAIAVDLEAIEYEGEKPVEQARVFENTTDFVNARGLPPKSIEALVFDGVAASLPNNVIAQALWHSKAGGIKTYGNESGTALDRNGDTHVMRFSRPAIVPFGLFLTVVVDVLSFEGEEALTVAIAEGMNALRKAEMIVAFSDVIDLAKNVRGVKRVTSTRLFDVAYPIHTDYPMGYREIPLFDSGDVFPTIVNG